MELNTQLYYSDMTSDEDNGPGERSMHANLYIDGRGTTPLEKGAIKEILDRHYNQIRQELRQIKL